MNLWKHKLSGTYFLYPLKEQNGSSREFEPVDKSVKSKWTLVIPKEYL